MEERPGVGRHLLVAAAVALAAVLIAVVWLGHKQRRFASTDSIAPADWVAKVDPGARLCVGRQWMPAGSNAIRLRLASSGSPNRRVALALRTPEGARTAAASAGGSRGHDVDFAVRPLSHDARVTVCLRPGSSLRVAGMRERKVAGVGYDWRRFQGEGPSPVELDGKPVDGRVSVWFLDPQARTLAATLPDVVGRATTFRPGFVGRGTYLVMLALLALMWFVGFRLLWGGRA
jgi:hypothetical protein